MKKLDDLITKRNRLYSLFKNIGDRHPITYVLDITGIDSYPSLRQHLHYLRKKGRINIRIKFGFMERKK